jgi:hypothetical protein
MPKPAVTRINGAFAVQANTLPNNGLYAPRLTTTQRNTIPASVLANGAIIYNTTTNRFELYQNGQWGTIAAGISTGTAPTVGSATLAGGTVTVNTTAVNASSNIFLQTQGIIGTNNSGNVRVSAIAANTSFTITSSDVADTSIVRWFIVNA